MVTIILPCRYKHKIFFMTTFTVNHRLKLTMRVQNDQKVTGLLLQYSRQSLPLSEVKRSQDKENGNTAQTNDPNEVETEGQASASRCPEVA